MQKVKYFLLKLLVLTSFIACDSNTDEDFILSAQTNPLLIANINNKVLCTPLQLASSNIISVDPSQASQLQSIISSAKPGDTILLADGVYKLEGSNLWLSTPGISLRSSSGNPAGVILDGSYKSSEVITVAASDITIAELTISRASTHPLHVISSNLGNTENTLIYRVNLIDPGEQAIKINPHAEGSYVDNGTVACSSIKLTEQGRPHVNTAAGGCYTGGIDAHQARDWTIRDNYIEGFWCASGLSEYAIHFWRGSRDTLIERNFLKDNARGIGLGMMNSGAARSYDDNSCPEAKDAYIGHYGGIIRNNFIHASATGLFDSSAGFDCGICLWSSCKTTTTHNTIVSTANNFSSIEWRFAGSAGHAIYNNIATHSLRERDGASGNLKGNLEHAGLSLFVDGQQGDLHLTTTASSAIDKGLKLYPGVNDFDFDNEPRDRSPDIGADENSYFANKNRDK